MKRYKSSKIKLFYYILILIMIILNLCLIGCTENTEMPAVAENIIENISTEPGAAPEVTPQTNDIDYNYIFVNTPDTLKRDEERPFEPTDIFQFWEYDYENHTLPEETLRSHVSVMCPGFYLYEPGIDDTDDLKSKLYTTTELAAHGIRVINWHPNYSYLCEHPSEYDNLYAVDVNGNIIYANPDVIGSSGPRYCINNPKWQEYITNHHLNAAKCGACDTNCDEWACTNACFCDHCMEQFGDYLKQKYSDKELMLLGVEDIDNFSYDEYIKENYYEEYISHEHILNISSNIPLSSDYSEFKYISVNDFEKRLKSELDNYNALYGTDTMLSTNMGDLMGGFLGCASTVDVFTPETNLPYVPSPRAALRYELANAFGTIYYAMPNCVFNAEMMFSEDATEMTKIYTAEAYSHGAFLQSPFLAPYKAEEGKSIAETHTVAKVNMDELYPYYDYIYNNGMLFEQLFPMAEIGVLFSFESHRSNWGSEKTFWDFSQTLVQRNIPFKYIATGDDEFIDKQLCIDELEYLNLIILPAITDISENDSRVLNEFMSKGGKILAFNGCGLEADKNNEENFYYLNEIFSWTVKDDWNLPKEEIFQMEEPENIDIIINSIDDLSQIPYSINDDKVVITQYYSGNTEGYIYHLVNYNFIEDEHRVNDKKNIEITLLNDTPYAIEDLSLFYTTPEIGNFQEIEFSANGNTISAVIPEISAWGTLLLGDEEKIQAAINENNEKLEIKDEARISDAEKRADEIFKSLEAAKDLEYEIAPVDVVNYTRKQEQPDETDEFIYRCMYDENFSLITIFPEDIYEVLNNYEYYYISISSENDKVRYFITLDLNAMEDIVDKISKIEGAEVNVINERTYISCDNYDIELFEHVGELHIHVLKNSDDNLVYLENVYANLLYCFDFPEIDELKNNPECSLSYNHGTFDFGIYCKNINDDKYEELKRYYVEYMPVNYPCSIDTEDTGRTNIYAHLTDRNIAFNLFFNDADRSIELLIYLRMEK